MNGNPIPSRDWTSKTPQSGAPRRNPGGGARGLSRATLRAGVDHADRRARRVRGRHDLRLLRQQARVVRRGAGGVLQRVDRRHRAALRGDRGHRRPAALPGGAAPADHARRRILAEAARPRGARRRGLLRLQAAPVEPALRPVPDPHAGRRHHTRRAACRVESADGARLPVRRPGALGAQQRRPWPAQRSAGAGARDRGDAARRLGRTPAESRSRPAARAKQPSQAS